MGPCARRVRTRETVPDVRQRILRDPAASVLDLDHDAAVRRPRPELDQISRFRVLDRVLEQRIQRAA